MKTLRLIYMAVAAAFIMAACDDEGIVNEYATLETTFFQFQSVDFDENGWTVSWYPTFQTNHGRAVFAGNGETFRYELYAENETDVRFLIKSGEFEISNQNKSISVVVAGNEVEQALAATENFRFSLEIINGIAEGKKLSQDDYMVAVAVAGEGKGGKIKCDRYKIGDYTVRNYRYYKYLCWSSENIELTAEPNQGYEFEKWSDGSTENPRDVLVQGNTYLEAVFKEESDNGTQVVVEKFDVSAGVKSSVGGIVTGAGSYAVGETALLQAMPDLGYKFTGWSDGNTENPRKVSKSISVEATFVETNYEIESYSSDNEWFKNSNIQKAVVENGTMIVDIEGANAWDDNIAVLFKNLDGQKEGSEFLIEFDIEWEGDNAEADICLSSGADSDNLGWGAWNKEDNTEILFDGDFADEQYKAYSIANSWKHISWGGKIGPKGEERIGIQINLSGQYVSGQNKANGKGTFRIANTQVLINGKRVW